MIQLTQEQLTTLHDWFMPERPGPLIGPHILNTGHGTVRADRWPQPSAIFADTAGNCSLAGDPTAFAPADFQGITGMIEATPKNSASGTNVTTAFTSPACLYLNHPQSQPTLSIHPPGGLDLREDYPRKTCHA